MYMYQYFGGVFLVPDYKSHVVVVTVVVNRIP